MKSIQLTKGKITIVDDEDYDFLSAYGWYASETQKKGVFYAKASIKNRPTYLHRFLLGIVDRKISVDHIDGDTLNNQKYNLRTCTHSQNMQNKKQRISTYKYKGVLRKKYKDREYWFAYISIKGVNTYIGSFKNEEQAALAYNERAKELWGEFANLNKVLTPTG